MTTKKIKKNKFDEAVFITSITFGIIVTCITIIILFSQIIQDSVTALSQSTIASSNNVLGAFDTSVTVTSSCGNEIVDGSDECDGSDLGDETCTSLGYIGGTLSCNENCTFNTSACTPYTPLCGNNIKDSDEECDISDFGGTTCESFGYYGGTLTCNTNCTFDKSYCITYFISETVIEESSQEAVEGEFQTFLQYIEYKGIKYNLDYIPRIVYTRPLYLYGKTFPLALVTVTVNSDPHVYETRADSEGSWSVEINTEILELGEHTFLVEVTHNSKKETHEPETFMVISEDEEVFRLPETGDQKLIDRIGELEIPRFVLILITTVISVAISVYVFVKIRSLSKEESRAKGTLKKK